MLIDTIGATAFRLVQPQKILDNFFYSWPLNFYSDSTLGGFYIGFLSISNLICSKSEFLGELRVFASKH